MNNNEISNKKTAVPNTSEMNDKDYITTLLLLEKAMVKNYSVALTEASNNYLYEDFYDMFSDVSDMQREIYDLMFKKGWYELEIADENKVTQKFDSLSQELSQIQINS